MNKIALFASIFIVFLISECNSAFSNASLFDSYQNLETTIDSSKSTTKGYIIPDKNITISTRVISTEKKLNEPQLNARRHKKTNTIKLAPVKSISYGQGKFPSISVIPLGEPEITYKKPDIIPALPFQNVIHNKLSYKTLGIPQGLKSAFITSVFQDSRGYFWFGSRRGLTRYDSQSFQYYPFANDDQHRGIGAITEDKEGNLWMTFGSFGGLIKFDGHYFYEYKEGQGLNLGEQYLGIVHIDKKGNIWLKSETQIIRFDGKEFTCFPYQFQNLKNLNVIIKENEKGNFWLSALGGVCYIQDNKMDYYSIEESSENNLCHPVIEDERGVIITTGTGITILKNDSLHVYPATFIANNQVRNTLTIDEDFVLATQQKRMGICNINDSVLTITSDNTPVFTNAHPLFIDEFKNIWLSTSGKGVQCYNPEGFKHFKFEELKKGGNVSAVLEDKNGNVWLGSHGFGLYKYDGYKHTYYDLIKGRTEISIRSLIQDSEGNIWAGTVYFGVYKIEDIDSPTPKVTRINCFKDEDLHVFALTEDFDKNIWIGTRTKGLLKFDGDQFIQYPFNKENPANIRTLLTDKEGNVWIGLENGGLKKYDGKSFTSYTVEDGLSSNHVVSLAQNSDGSIWIGTSDNGVNRFENNTFSSITTKNGLSSNAIWTITEDAEKNIWLGADNCLNIILAKTDSSDQTKIITHCDLDGLEGGEFYANSGIIDKRKQLWWGSDQMAVMITNPKNLLSQGKLKIALEDVNIVNNRIDFKLLQDSIEQNKHWYINETEKLDLATIKYETIIPFVNCPEKLSLPPTLNDLKFIYSVRGSKNAENVEFSYFMEGIDKNWSIPSSSNFINYRGIPSGTYTLKAKVSEIKGIWSEPYTYTFTVLPFWWETWWAYALWIFLGFIFIWGINNLLNIRRKEKEDAKHLKEMDTVKSQLYANITHEFRTPLTLIIGMNEQIDGHEKEKTVIRRNSEKLLLQINQLLDAAKVESGTLKTNLIQRDIVSYIRFLTDSFYGLASVKNIKLTFYTEVDSLKMDYDEEKIQVIIYNLLSNAVKFTPNDGNIVCHLSKINHAKKDQFQLKIKDSGLGIPEDQLNKIFERFYQADNIKKRTNIGSGIGLALTKSLVGLMQGQIKVESTVNKGTTFTVNLPITNNSTEVDNLDFTRPVGWETEETSIDSSPSPVLNENPDALHLLIIEDNIEIANYLAGIFNKTYITHIAENGKLGVDKAIKIIPDAIISDISMPEMDGYEVCENLKNNEKTSHIPIVLLTAKTAQEEKMSGLKVGADMYITKPFYRDELELCLEKLISTRQKLQRYYSTLNSDVKEENASTTTKFSPIEESFLEKLNTIIQKHLTDSEFGVPELAQKSELSQMQVYRKLKALINKTPSQFIRSYRLNKGLELLQNSDLNISEIAYEVGFSDPNYFSRTFHKEFGNPPGHYRKQLNKKNIAPE